MYRRNRFDPWYGRPRGQGYGPAPEPIPTRTPEPAPAPVEPQEDKVAPAAANETDWQEKSIRLQAEMENFRKRQMRRAEEAIAGERERLLNLFLPVIDNLERALAQQQGADESLHKGVELTHREMMRRLEQEGVTRLETIGEPLDPELHEAIATIPAQAEPGTIVKELEAGYKIGDKLLRPARVIVAA